LIGNKSINGYKSLDIVNFSSLSFGIYYNVIDYQVLNRLTKVLLIKILSFEEYHLTDYDDEVILENA